MPMYRKCTKFMAASRYFMRREWNYNNDRMLSVYDRMSLADREFFPCDVRRFSFRNYCPAYLLGMRKYIGGEDMNVSQEQAKARFWRLKWLHRLVLGVYYAFLATVIYNVLKFFGYIDTVQYVLSLITSLFAI